MSGIIKLLSAEVIQSLLLAGSNITLTIVGDQLQITASGGGDVTLNGIQTLTNKTLTDNTTFFQDDLDNTKKLQLQLSGLTTGITRTITIPDVSTTLLGRNGVGVNNAVPKYNGANEVIVSALSVINNIMAINSGSSIVGCELVNGGSTTINSYIRVFAGGDFFIYAGAPLTGVANKFGVSVRNRLFLESFHTQGMYLGTAVASPLVFNTNNVERARITETGEFGIGTSTPNSTLHVNGSVSYAYLITSASGSVSAANKTIEINGNTVTIQTLPSAIGIAGREHTFINASNVNQIVATTLSQTIGNLPTGNKTSITLRKGDWITVISNGSNWRIV